MMIKRLNDGTKGFRFRFGKVLHGMVRVRKQLKRYEITNGNDFRGIHFGKVSLYFRFGKAWNGSFAAAQA